MIHLQDLGYTFDRSRIRLPGEHKFSAGEIVHLRGTNGVGKTTILRIVAGLLDDFEGICNFPLGWSVRYIPTDIRSSLFLPWYTVRQNIDILVQGPVARARAEELGSRFLNSRFLRLLNQPAYTPSAGESAAIAVACAVAGDPNAILLDETLSYVAPALASTIIHELEEFVLRRRLIVFVQHNDATKFKTPVREVNMLGQGD